MEIFIPRLGAILILLVDINMILLSIIRIDSNQMYVCEAIKDPHTSNIMPKSILFLPGVYIYIT